MKYQIGQNLKVIKENRVVKVSDYEIFDDFILYYTTDKKAYPENELENNFFFYLCSIIMMPGQNKFTEDEIEIYKNKLNQYELD